MKKKANAQKIDLSLLENSHKFLKEAVEKARAAKTDPDSWQFAIIHLVQAVELSLKAALADVHPVLLYENIDAPTRTVNIQKAAERLSSRHMGNITFSNKDIRRMAAAVKIRNQMMHADFSMHINQMEAKFHEVFAFLSECNRRMFSININELVDPDYLVEFLESRKHHKEMLKRAQTRITDEKIKAHELRCCEWCNEDTLVEMDEVYLCYLCHNKEPQVYCGRCEEYFTEAETEDFSDAFETDNSEGLYVILNNYGYGYRVACHECAAEIREEIANQADIELYHHLEEEHYYKQIFRPRP